MPKRNKIKIGILGVSLHDGNMGCMALTYSMIYCLDKISSNKKYSLEYIFFDRDKEFSPEELEVWEYLNIDISKIKEIKRNFLGNNFKILYWLNYIRNFMTCSVFMDITGGDSFSDIYGDKRFLKGARTKRIIEILKKPLVLLPQTYGPFTNVKNIKMVTKIIDEAEIVLSRDDMSRSYIKEISGKQCVTTTDLAFGLPYTKKTDQHDKINVGINVSGLLVKDHYEKVGNHFAIMTDYDKYINSLLDYLNEKEKYEVYLIPHTTHDSKAVKVFQRDNGNVHIVDLVCNPITMKSIISDMDIFIGARMHATVAALSSGVATIPTAYSRKFEGLFSTVGYTHCVDLYNLDTVHALEKTINYIENYMQLKKDAKMCQQEINSRLLENEKIIGSALDRIWEKQYGHKGV